jgi:hypothetical protein
MYAMRVLEVGHTATRGPEEDPIFYHQLKNRTALCENLEMTVCHCRIPSVTNHNHIVIISTDARFSFLSVRTPSMGGFSYQTLLLASRMFSPHGGL